MHNKMLDFRTAGLEQWEEPRCLEVLCPTEKIKIEIKILMQIISVDCPEGMYGDGAQTPQCKECPVGQYNTLTKQSQCTACTDGKSTLTTGSTSADDCKSMALFLPALI